jgi:hypothetical protein
VPYFTKNVDWLSLTFPHDFPFKHYLNFDEFIRTGNGQHGYRNRFEGLNTGVIVQSGSRDDMGTHVTISGQSMQSLRDNLELTDKQICARMIDCGARASRIDLAVTIIDGKLTPASLHKDLKSGKLKPSARKFSFVSGQTGDISGDTLYIGSRQSEKFFRAYNKASEMGIVDGVAMIRLEMELKALYARAATHNVAINGVSATTNAVMSEFLGNTSGELAQALSGESSPFRAPQKQKSNTELWILTQVAKAIARVSMTNEDIVKELLIEVDRYRAALDAENDANLTT